VENIGCSESLPTYTYGAGLFSQSGGSNATSTLSIGVAAPGEYDLSGTGTVTVTNATVGSSNYTGTLKVSGGVFTVTSEMTIAGGATLTQSAGSITAPQVSNSGTITQTAGLASLGGITGTGTTSIGTSSGASASLTVTSIKQPVITINNPGKLTILKNTNLVTNLANTLSISGNGTLDITNNRFYIDYSPGADPISSIAAWIQSGYNAGAWNGPGITSSTAAGNSKSYGIGYADSADPGNPAGLSSGQIEIMYTLLGDANLDGKVNGSDFILMAANFNKAVTNGWDEGDFNYDGKVNGDDFVLLADNFNQFASQSADVQALDAFAAANGISLTSVPEPATISLTILPAASLLLRRRKFLGQSAVHPRSACSLGSLL